MKKGLEEEEEEEEEELHGLKLTCLKHAEGFLIWFNMAHCTVAI